MSFWDIAALRTILDTETDANSPGSEELMSQIRENIEALILLLLSTGVSGTATSDPSNDANGYFYDTAGGWTDDLHNGRTLLITSGAAKGNMYTIDDTVDGSDRLACTGDNLYAYGVRSGDSYQILFDVKVNTDGHNHDGINSPSPALGDASIVMGKLKTGVATASGSGGGVITGQDYCFAPNIYTIESDAFVTGDPSESSDYVMRFSIVQGVLPGDWAVRYRYITSSDEPFMYAIRDKSSGEILHVWLADDPPPGYWGNDRTPEGFVPPIIPINKDGTSAFDQFNNRPHLLFFFHDLFSYGYAAHQSKRSASSRLRSLRSRRVG